MGSEGFEKQKSLFAYRNALQHFLAQNIFLFANLLAFIGYLPLLS